jgi:hypothetical protein
LPKLLLLGLTLTSLTACTTLSTGTPPVVIDTSCSAFKPITYSASQDTPETVSEVRAHNRVFTTLCP